jgi:uncharacterized protein YndB with AHSA1/START domain
MTMTSGRTATVTLPTDEQILITRDFDAPPELVYRAWTTPELVARWWTAKRGEATVVEIDLRVGGRWRYVMTMPDGFEVAFHGEYREIVPNQRIVSTEVYEGATAEQGYPDAEAVNTVSFAEANGGTRLTILVVHPSQTVRDAVIASRMEDGLQDALELLEALAISLG